MNRLKIVFIGCVEFSALALKKMIQQEYPPVAVLTKSKSDFNSDFVDLQPIANANGIPSKSVIDINHLANVEWIKNWEPDVIFCFGWSSLIKVDILNIPSLGVIGFHPSLLPFNRGRHPIIWALVLGLRETGSSFFFMDEGADSGDILSQKTITIDEVDSARTLYDKITNTALTQIEAFLPALADGHFERKKQPKGIGNVWRKRSKSDGKIDFRMTAHSIVNLVKAISKPYPGAYLELNNEEFVVWKAALGDSAPENIEPGQVLEIIGQEVRVKCCAGSVWLLDHDINEIPSPGKYLL